MIKIIDTNNETTQRLSQLRARGIECVIRYVSTPAEAKAIAGAGLKLALVYETWGGVNNFSHNDINAASGQRDGDFARGYAPTVGAPDNAIIYFAIDTDCTASQYAQLVKPYLIAAKAALQGKYRIGVYACGFVCDRALQEHLVDATWLTQSMGFNGSRAFRDSGRWTLLQGPETALEGLSIDSNEANGDDYGAFVPFQAVPATVIAGPAVLPQQIGPLATGPVAPQAAQMEQSLARLGQIVNALSQAAALRSGLAPGGGGALPAQMLSPIDKLLGGSAFVGLKTPIAIFGYLGLWVLQSLDAVGTATGDKATTTGSVLTALFSGLGAGGVTAKFDRVFQAISAISAALQKLPLLPPPPPKADGT
jgi:Domain of unknown function (DUF1906)